MFIYISVICHYALSDSYIKNNVRVKSPKPDVSRLPVSKHTAADSGKEPKLQ